MPNSMSLNQSHPIFPSSKRWLKNKCIISTRTSMDFYHQLDELIEVYRNFFLRHVFLKGQQFYHQIFFFFFNIRVRIPMDFFCILASYNPENIRFLEASCSYLRSNGAIL